jgi:hypothetical protein
MLRKFSTRAEADAWRGAHGQRRGLPKDAYASWLVEEKTGGCFVYVADAFVAAARLEPGGEVLSDALTPVEKAAEVAAFKDAARESVSLADDGIGTRQ